MSSEWRRLTLDDAGVELIDCDHRTPPAADQGYPYIAIPQLRDGHIHLDGVRRISAHDYEEWTRKLKPKADDVIVVRRCNSGQSAVVPSALECAIGQNLVVLRADGKTVAPKYLRWLVRGDEWWNEVARYINVGAVFDSLRCRDIPKFTVPIPSLATQNEIADVLGALDNRITLLRETNATLEAIAQALFKSWFVDFDPVRAKMEGRAPKGMDEETAALFPCELENHTAGLLPKGWQRRSIYDVSSVIYGAPFSSRQFLTTPLGVPLVRIRDLKNEQPGVYTQEVLPRGYLLQPGDIAVGMDGEFRTYLWGGEPALVNQRVCVFKLRDGVPSAFVRLSIDPLLAEVEASETATTVIHLGKSDIDRFTVVLPPQVVMRAFSEVVTPVYESIVSNKAMQRTLADIRDTLLPRLISGKLRLPEAEQLTEEALA